MTTRINMQHFYIRFFRIIIFHFIQQCPIPSVSPNPDFPRSVLMPSSFPPYSSFHSILSYRINIFYFYTTGFLNRESLLFPVSLGKAINSMRDIWPNFVWLLKLVYMELRLIYSRARHLLVTTSYLKFMHDRTPHDQYLSSTLNLVLLLVIY